MKFFLFISIGFLYAIVMSAHLFTQADREHNRIIENVSVNWWQVPVFAVDKDGNPVTDLDTKDLEIRLNGWIISKFTLNKRSFSVIESKTETIQTPSARQTPMQKPKVVFLLFDQALSGPISTHRAKELAQKIIMDASGDTRFYVLSIDAFAGLVYIGEGTAANKEYLVKLIQDKIIEKKNKRIVDISDFIAGGGGKRSKYEEGEIDLFYEIASKWYKRKSMGWLYAFDSLYLYLNSIEDSKFLYFFSEGMSHSILTANRSLAGDRGMYNSYFKRIAKKLGRCGAVIFVINSKGVDQSGPSLTMSKYSKGLSNSFSNISGEESLHLITKESGGTYMEGDQQEIVENLERMHRAYYEIAFPDPPQIKGTFRDIAVIPIRKGIVIHSLKHLEKPKSYVHMKPVEKDILALNLVTQPQNMINKDRIAVFNAVVKKTKKDKNKIVYKVVLPPNQFSQELDLYKFYLTTGSNGISQVQKIEKETIRYNKKPLSITFDLSEYRSKKDKRKGTKEKVSTPREIQTYFVLVNKTNEPVRAYVRGLELFEDDPELSNFLKEEKARKQKRGKTISDVELQRILQGAADYCERLKQSAFHFYCREKILETSKPLSEADVHSPDISEIHSRRRYSSIRNIQKKVYTQVKGYLFGYRLIKKGDKIKEERDFISSRDEVPVSRDQVIKTTAFFSEKSIFAPITLLDKTRQKLYRFQFVRFTHYGDRQAVVISAIPKNSVESASIFGDIWIDRENFSVMKIEADPKSIKSYSLLEEIAGKLRTRLSPSLEIEFNHLHDGIRFPTEVNMLEKYIGGRIIRKYQGTQGWERTRVQFSYSDYRFFSVQTDVEIE